MQISKFGAMVLAGAFVLGSVSVAAAAPGDERPATRKPGQGNQQGREEMLKRFDKNGNGKLDQDEMQAARQAMAQRGGPGGGERMSREEMLKRYDKNNNGKLDPEEIQAARQAMAGKRGQPGAGGPQGQGREEMLKRFDKNGNGKLDPEEMRAAQTERSKRGPAGGRPNRPAPNNNSNN